MEDEYIYEQNDKGLGNIGGVEPFNITDAALKVQGGIPDKTTMLAKAQPVKFKTNMFSKGFKVDIEYNFDYKNSHEIDQILKHDSYLRTALKGFIKMVEVETGAKLIKDD